MKTLFQQIYLLLITILLISCGNISTYSELPEFKLISTNEPKVSSNGNISPRENLEYIIEIPRTLEKDSLEMIQDYFIEKGHNDFNNVNKIIVRVYIKGTSLDAMPYAMLNLIGDKKDIIINGSSQDANFINQKLEGYKIIGCWVFYKNEDLVICEQGNKYYQTYIDKEKQEVGELSELSVKTVNGKTAYHVLEESNKEYMVIESDGLHIYDESGETGTAPMILAQDTNWDKI